MLFILYGLYFWAARRIAYRNDYCLRCEDVRLAALIRTFDVGHLFFVPLLPLGYRRRWRCSACGSNPHERVKTSHGVKVFAAVGLAIAAAVGWFVPIERPEDVAFVWGWRVVMSLAFLGALAWCRTKPPTSLKELLATVPPLPRDACAFCHGALDAQGFCSVCKVSCLELPASRVPARVNAH